MDLLAAATGFFLGLRHALEPDHVAAVAQFASADPRPRRGLSFGLAWGAGHGLALMALGGAVVSFGPRPGPGFERVAEAAVGAVLIGLALWRLLRLTGVRHEHSHRHGDGIVHSHPHVHGVGHLHLHAPTLTGLVHGTAGLVGVLALLPSRSPLLALLAFALGGCAAMGLMGFLAARFYEATSRWWRWAGLLTAASGLALGAVWIARSAWPPA